MGKLRSKVAVVTGGSSGIGLATAKRFAAEGAHVFITGRRRAELDGAVAAIGDGVTAVRGDAADLADLDRLFATVRHERGRLDILVANAGGGAVAPLGAITEAQVDATLGLNVKGTLFTAQKALPLMRAGGSIILVGSTFASMAAPGFSVYGASKAAIRGFARTWALDLKGSGIRVNVLVPGPTDTPGLRGTLRGTAGGEAEANEMVERLIEQTPLGRLGEPDDLAAAALFLASDDSGFMTGGEVFVDGGQAQV